MNGHGCGTDPFFKVVLGIGLAVLTATQAFAEHNFSCTFARECATDGACIGYAPQTMLFTHDSANRWLLASADGHAIPFSELQTDSDDLRAFVSAKADPDAPAVSLLSMFDNGLAILGIHGVFLSPGSLTHLGECQEEGG